MPAEILPAFFRKNFVFFEKYGILKMQITIKKGGKTCFR